MTDITEWVPLVLGVLSALAAIMAFRVSLRHAPAPIEAEVLHVDGVVSLPHPENQFVPAPLDLERILHQYHDRSLEQARYSFWFSLTFATLGFFVIVMGFVMMWKGQNSGSIASLTSGTIIEAVSALFFVQSNRARQLLVQFFDRLRADRSLNTALKLAQSIEDPVLKARLQATLALQFANIDLRNTSLAQLFAGTSANLGPAVGVSEPEQLGLRSAASGS